MSSDKNVLAGRELKSFIILFYEAVLKQSVIDHEKKKKNKNGDITTCHACDEISTVASNLTQSSDFRLILSETRQCYLNLREILFSFLGGS